MKKRVILIAIAAILITAASFAVGGSVAYFRAESQASDKVSAGNLGIELVNRTRDTDTESTQSGIFFKGGMPGDVRHKEVFVRNTKNYELYLRVTVTKFWEDKNGAKSGLADAGYIELVTRQPQDWMIVDDDENREVVEFYYRKPLKAGEETVNVLDEFRVSSDISNGGELVYTDMTTNIQIHADAVQAIGAQSAMLSEWGLDVRFDADGAILSVNE